MPRPQSRFQSLSSHLLCTSGFLAAVFISAFTHALASSESDRLHDWLDEQYEQELSFEPQTLTTLGRKELYDQLNDPSVEALERRIAWFENSVENMRKSFDYNKLDAIGKTSYDFWAFRLRRLADSRNFIDLQLPMSQLQGPQSDLPSFLISYHAVDSVQDMQDYISRIDKVGPTLLTTLDNVKTSAAHGVRAPRFAYDEVITQLKAVISGAPFDDNEAPSPLWQDVNEKVDALLNNKVIDSQTSKSLKEAARSALTNSLLPAYTTALAWFEDDIPNSSEDPMGAHNFARGGDYYAERLRYYTTTDKTAAEIHQLGLSEVARIQKAMGVIMQDVGFEGTLREFFDHVREDARFYYQDTEAGRQAFIEETQFYLDRLNKKLPEYFGVLPKADLEVSRVEAFRERDGAAAFYEEGTADGSRPGVYYMHLSDMQSNNRTDIQTTAYHEGNPGHHMQVSIALEQDDLPLFRRDVWYSGYGEGWALYAEQVAYEMGVYDDAYYDFGRLSSEIFRAIRLVVDTGIHAFGWSEEESVQYMLANSAVPEGSARSEIQRYIVWPGQATSYKIGMLKLLELREYAQTMLGDNFDIRKFHDQVLVGGSLPLEILERQVRNWVTSELNLQATVRRDTYGIPHITADDFASLGYGEGYAAAEDHICTIAYEYTKARGELSRYLGPGQAHANIASDKVIRGLDVVSRGKSAFAAQTPEIKRWLVGYSEGINRFLKDHPGQRNTSWCSGANWLTPTSPLDVMNRMVALAMTLPRLSSALSAVRPPIDSQAAADSSTGMDVLAQAALVGLGSNGWAMGSELTENGRGLLLANPHYPWYGGDRFWEKHLTIPGKFNAYGVVTLGAPGVAIGFNRNLGWTHTVSASQRLVLYRLTLDPDNPMRYRFGDVWREIEQRKISIPVLQGDGSLQEQDEIVYFSHHGPLLTMPNMSWDNKYAYSVRDANIDNTDLLTQWKAMGEAQNLDEFIDAHRNYNAMPWVNTIAASADGRALYLDNSTVGNLSVEAQQNWRASLAQDRLAAGIYQQRRMLLLNGSDPANDWVDSGAPIPDTVPFDERPMLERSDYVFNSNDSYWLTNPDEPLSGYSVLYGPTESARSPRTRMNARMLSNRYGDAGDDARFSIREVQSALFSNRGLSAELLKPELVELCREHEDVLQACDVLASYDGSLNLDSPGAVLFREWLTRYEPLDTVTHGKLFAEPFRADTPVTTPSGLGEREAAITALREAVGLLKEAEIALDATLRDTQFAYRAGDPIPVHGGNGFEGVANLQMSGNPAASPIAGVNPRKQGDSRYLTDAGYPVVHGSSFILTLAFEDTGPVAQALLSYSQSGNPNAKHFKDQTLLYKNKQWRDVAFEPEDVDNATVSLRVLRSADIR